MDNLYFVDRFEEDFAILESPDKSSLTVPRSQLPEGVREGDCLVKQGDSYSIDEAETQKRRIAAAELTRKLFGKS